MFSRRQWIARSAGTAALTHVSTRIASAGEQGSGSGKKPVVISSANGVAACAKAMEMLKTGADTLDAVIAGVNIVELDPNDTSVGYGGLPNEEGVVELDASVMHGPSRRCGSVGAIQGIKTPSKIAKLVMDRTTHVMLVGQGATKFAGEHGYPIEDLMTEKSRTAWLVWKESLKVPSGFNNWNSMDSNIAAATASIDKEQAPLARLKRSFPNADDETLAWALKMAVHPTYGTINCLALNEKGEMSGVTTTSGLAWKIPGRLGDSPIIGAGLFLDQDVGGAGSTGLGEENIRISGAHTIVEDMRRGLSPQEAVVDALKRVSRNYKDDIHKLDKIDIQFYALRKDGAHAGGSLWGSRRGDTQYSVDDGSGQSRHEDCIFLYSR